MIIDTIENLRLQINNAAASLKSARGRSIRSAGVSLASSAETLKQLQVDIKAIVDLVEKIAVDLNNVKDLSEKLEEKIEAPRTYGGHV